MIKAIFKHGAVQLIEPLPPEWEDGQLLVVKSEDEYVDDMTREEIDADFAEIVEDCSTIDPAEHSHQAKVQNREEMGAVIMQPSSIGRMEKKS
jgi:hypothetical protein